MGLKLVRNLAGYDFLLDGEPFKKELHKPNMQSKLKR